MILLMWILGLDRSDMHKPWPFSCLVSEGLFAGVVVGLDPLKILLWVLRNQLIICYVLHVEKISSFLRVVGGCIWHILLYE